MTYKLTPLIGVATACAFSLGMAGCSAPMGPGSFYDHVSKEWAAATASKPKAPAKDLVDQAMLPPLKLDLPAEGKKPEPRFDLAVINAPASQVFMALVSGTSYSMVFAPDLSGTITINLKHVTLPEALFTIREVYGYEYKVQGNRIIIQSNAMQTRIFQVNYLAGSRKGSSDTRVTSSSPSVVSPGGTGTGTTSAVPGGGTPTNGIPGSPSNARSTDSSRITTISDNDFWKGLETALGAIVSSEEGQSVILNPMSGVILVKARPNELRSVESYLRATKLMIERQVMLEAKIIDVQLNDSFQTGVNWAKFIGNDHRVAVGVLAPNASLRASGALFGTATGIGNTGTQIGAQPGKGGAIATSDAGKGFFGLAFQSTDFAALLSFLETQGSVQVLSSPRVATINNQKAVLKVGVDDYFVTGISTTTTTSTTSNQVTPNITLLPFFSGIALDVTPQIDEEGNIILHVHPSITQVEEKTKQVNLGDLGTFTLPLASSSINETDSIVRVQDGNIVAIGGLMSQEQNKNRNGLPFISRTPFFGQLFGQTSNSSSKRELVILIKPTVIQNENTWQQDLQDTQSRFQSMAAVQ